MAKLLTMMLSTVKGSMAGVATLKQPDPFLGKVVFILGHMDLSAQRFIRLFATDDFLFDLTTVASSINTDFTCSAKPFVARSITIMFSARHKLSANLATGPTILVVSIDTSSCDSFSTTETALLGSHLWTGWTRSGMARV
jgi:hypothetical protein